MRIQYENCYIVFYQENETDIVLRPSMDVHDDQVYVCGKQAYLRSDLYYQLKDALSNEETNFVTDFIRETCFLKYRNERDLRTAISNSSVKFNGLEVEEW